MEQKESDHIAAVLAWITGPHQDSHDDPEKMLLNLQALAADYERQREEIERQNALLQERNSKLAAQQLSDMGEIEELRSFKEAHGRMADAISEVRK